MRRDAKRIVCVTLWYPEHNNVRAEQLFPRLDPWVRFHKVPLSRSRLIRAAQTRIWRWLKRPLIYPLVFRYLARKYDTLLAFDTDQVSGWPKSNSVIVDTDDPRFSSTEVAFLGKRQVRAIVVTMDEARRAFRKMGVDKPIHVIPQGVDTEWLDRGRIGFMQGIEKGERDIVAGYLAPSLTLSSEGSGRWMGGQDDLDLLFEAFEASQKLEGRLKLWLIGRPSEAVAAYAQDKPWLRLFGYMPLAETWKYVSNFDIGLYPRIQPTLIRFPNKVAQYMACGVPIVSTLKEPVLERAGCGVLCGSAQELTEALVDLARSLEKRQTLGQSGAQYARAHLSWPRLVKDYERILFWRYRRGRCQGWLRMTIWVRSLLDGGNENRICL